MGSFSCISKGSLARRTKDVPGVHQKMTSIGMPIHTPLPFPAHDHYTLKKVKCWQTGTCKCFVKVCHFDQKIEQGTKFACYSSRNFGFESASDLKTPPEEEWHAVCSCVR